MVGPMAEQMLVQNVNFISFCLLMLHFYCWCVGEVCLCTCFISLRSLRKREVPRHVFVALSFASLVAEVDESAARERRLRPMT